MTSKETPEDGLRSPTDEEIEEIVTKNKGGRPVGSKNKYKPVRSTIKQWFIDRSVHPVDLIMETIKEQKKLLADLKPEHQSAAWGSIRAGLLDLLPYITPKATVKDEEASNVLEVAPEVEKTLQEMTPEELLKLVRHDDKKS